MAKIIIVSIFCALQILDIYSTLGVLRLGGREMNKLLVLLMEKLGNLWALVLMKSIVIAAVAGAWIFLGDTPLIAILCLLTFIYVYVVFQNFQVLKRLRG